MRPLLLSLLMMSLTACGVIGFPGVYKINVEQGNIVTQEDVDKLEEGMTRRQVRFILGTPLIEDTLNRDRWDYHYELKRGEKVIRQRELTVFFDGDRLQSVSGDYQPAWARDSDSGDSGSGDSPKAADAQDNGAVPAA